MCISNQNDPKRAPGHIIRFQDAHTKNVGCYFIPVSPMPYKSFGFEFGKYLADDL
jgi:hypothetical protein